MSELRALNQKGIDAFRSFINELKNNPKQEIPSNLLTENETSYSLGVEIDFEKGIFKTKYDAAKFLVENLDRKLSRSDIDHNSELWSWLALYYFDQLCPVQASGNRTPLRSDVYILPSINEPGFFRSYYRHLLSFPYKLLRLNPEAARALLNTPVNKNPDTLETISSRQNFIVNNEVINAVIKLYYEKSDVGQWQPKRGVTNYKKAGTMRRLVKVYDQFDLTYDLNGLTTDEFLNLLPAEFNKWNPVKQHQGIIS